MKNELRKKYLDLRKSKDEYELKKASETIVENLESISEFKKAETIMVYVSYRNEVDTHELITKLIGQNKRVCVPLCGENCSMTAREIKDFAELVSGSYGILEPKEDSPIVSKNDIDFVVVPGCVFSRNGHRIGYGKGYYDRFLDGMTFKTAGLCYSFCLLDEVPYEKTDIALDFVVTENGVVKSVKS